MTKKICNPVSRERLLEAMENTYEDARFLIGASTEKDSDFKKGWSGTDLYFGAKNMC